MFDYFLSEVYLCMCDVLFLCQLNTNWIMDHHKLIPKNVCDRHDRSVPRWSPGSRGRVQGGPRTRDGVLRVELERVVHEGDHDGGGVLAIGVGSQQRVVAVVDVGGLVEAQAAVPHSLVGR